jgi:NADPH:quinone reductase-like Zn-dependent oxidoreductase
MQNARTGERGRFLKKGGWDARNDGVAEQGDAIVHNKRFRNIINATGKTDHAAALGHLGVDGGLYCVGILHKRCIA